MVDETGRVSEEILKQTQEILEFAAQKTGKGNKEMAVTFVSNERSHELNLEIGSWQMIGNFICKT